MTPEQIHGLAKILCAFAGMQLATLCFVFIIYIRQK